MKKQSLFNKQAEKKPIKIHSELMTANVVVGATITLTVEDARGLLKVSDDFSAGDLDKIPDDKGVTIYREEYDKLYACSEILNKIAMTVLYTAGPTTSFDDLMNKMEIKESSMNDTKPEYEVVL